MTGGGGGGHCVVRMEWHTARWYRYRYSVFLGRLLQGRRPNNIIEWGKCPSVGESIRPYVRTQSISDFNEIWYVHRGR